MITNIEKNINFIFYFLYYNFNFKYFLININFFLKKYSFFFYFLKIIKINKIYFYYFNFFKNIFLRIFFLKKKFLNNNYNFKKIIFFNSFLFLNDNFLNPIKILSNRILNILFKWNFININTPDIENFFNNFTFLNISTNHPSSFFNDSFYINFDYLNKILLRTHTTSIQFYIKNYKKFPIKILSFGNVYRNDCDNTHLPIFNQFELIFISKFINFNFYKKFFINLINLIFKENKFKYRIRSSYFPFTILSYEIDIMYIKNNKKVWLEICGMGIIHPFILYNSNVNYNLYRGFALGIGLERIFMIFLNFKNLKKLFINF